MGIKVIITGTTGMVGEGVLMECLSNPDVAGVLSVSRRAPGVRHPKLTELIMPDFSKAEKYSDQLKGFDACFFCAGVSSIGMKEEEYYRATYETTLSLARALASVGNDMTFCYVSGQGTDSAEKGRLMWARVKGKTENDLLRLPFKAVYNFRPGMMKPTAGQKRMKPLYKFVTPFYPIFHFLFPNSACTISDLAKSMIQCALKGYEKNTIDVKDIKKLAAGEA
ncbi:MAG: NAD-dependent epimerase/dehydratase family protein [Chloroflexota bacterium]